MGYYILFLFISFLHGFVSSIVAYVFFPIPFHCPYMTAFSLHLGFRTHLYKCSFVEGKLVNEDIIWSRFSLLENRPATKKPIEHENMIVTGEKYNWLTRKREVNADRFIPVLFPRSPFSFPDSVPSILSLQRTRPRPLPPALVSPPFRSHQGYTFCPSSHSTISLARSRFHNSFYKRWVR